MEHHLPSVVVGGDSMGHEESSSSPHPLLPSKRDSSGALARIGSGLFYEKATEREALSRAISTANSLLQQLAAKKRKTDALHAEEPSASQPSSLRPTATSTLGMPNSPSFAHLSRRMRFPGPPRSAVFSRNLGAVLREQHLLRSTLPVGASSASTMMSSCSDADLAAEQELLVLLPKYRDMWYLNPLNLDALSPSNIRVAMSNQQLSMKCPLSELTSHGFTLCVAVMISTQLVGNMAISKRLCAIAERHWHYHRIDFDSVLAGLALWWFKLFVLREPASLALEFSKEALRVCKTINCNPGVVHKRVLLIKTLYTNLSSKSLRECMKKSMSTTGDFDHGISSICSDEQRVFLYKAVWALVMNMLSIMIDMVDDGAVESKLPTCIKVAEQSHTLTVYLASMNIPFSVSILFHRVFTALRVECWSRLGRKSEALRLSGIFLDMLRIRVHPLHEISQWVAMVLGVVISQSHSELTRALVNETREVFVPFFPSSTIRLLDTVNTAMATKSASKPAVAKLVPAGPPAPSQGRHGYGGAASQAHRSHDEKAFAATSTAQWAVPRAEDVGGVSCRSAAYRSDGDSFGHGRSDEESGKAPADPAARAMSEEARDALVVVDKGQHHSAMHSRRNDDPSKRKGDAPSSSSSSSSSSVRPQHHVNLMTDLAPLPRHHGGDEYAGSSSGGGWGGGHFDVSGSVAAKNGAHVQHQGHHSTIATSSSVNILANDDVDGDLSNDDFASQSDANAEAFIQQLCPEVPLAVPASSSLPSSSSSLSMMTKAPSRSGAGDSDMSHMLSDALMGDVLDVSMNSYGVMDDDFVSEFQQFLDTYGAL